LELAYGDLSWRADLLGTISKHHAKTKLQETGFTHVADLYLTWFLTVEFLINIACFSIK